MSNPTAADVLHELKTTRYSDGRGAWDSAEAMTAAVSTELRRLGIPHSPAQYDEGGNCLTCGEGGRCPGVHTFEEIQEAARAGLTRIATNGSPEQRAAARVALNSVYGALGHTEPHADPCKGCLGVGVTNCLNCVKKEAGHAD